MNDFVPGDTKESGMVRLRDYDDDAYEVVVDGHSRIWSSFLQIGRIAGEVYGHHSTHFDMDVGP